MVRKYASFFAILALGFIASPVSATNFTQSTAGGPVTMTVNTAVIPGGTDVAFMPSSQVNVAGASVTTSFAAITGHQAVAGKEAGQNYGMAADSASVFWTAAAATFPTFTDTNSQTIVGWTRN